MNIEHLRISVSLLKHTHTLRSKKTNQAPPEDTPDTSSIIREPLSRSFPSLTAAAKFLNWRRREAPIV